MMTNEAVPTEAQVFEQMREDTRTIERAVEILSLNHAALETIACQKSPAFQRDEGKGARLFVRVAIGLLKAFADDLTEAIEAAECGRPMKIRPADEDGHHVEFASDDPVRH